MAEKVNLGLNSFRDQLRDDLRSICKENGWNFDDVIDRGRALQLWTARLFCKTESGIDTDPDAALLSSNDLGVDVVLEDATRQILFLFQCKGSGLGKPSKLPPVDETEVGAFFGRHDLLMDRKWVRENGSEAAFQLLGDYRDQIRNGWTAEYYFVTTLVATERVLELESNATERFRREGLSVTCHLLDLAHLKDFYNSANSVQEQIADQVVLDLPEKSFIQRELPYRTLIAIIKGNVLRQLYSQHRETLFNHNIRDFLGKARAINKRMIQTAEEKPDEFFYFNNGVSAVCSQFEIKQGKLLAKRLQIINGAQTVGALKAADDDPEIFVLFRLTESNKGNFNEQIIRFNNTQNTINSSDFRANDTIQEWLEHRFSELKPKGPLPLIRYSRKRSFRRHPGSTVITLEEMAKVQQAFRYEPPIIYDLPKQLWTFQSEGGRYEKCFGVDDEMVNSWPQNRWELTLLAIAFILRISDETTAEVREAPENSCLKRLRYHLLGLAGVWFRSAKPRPDPRQLIADKGEFDRAFSNVWTNARQVLLIQFESARTDQMTLSAFARSPKRWDEMQRQFARLMKMKLDNSA